MAIDGLIRQFAPDFDVGGFLATSSRKYLTKHARKALLSHDALINWSKATADLMRSGAFRFSAYLERMSEARNSQVTARRVPSHRHSEHARCAAIAVIAVAVSVVALTTNESFVLGINLFTSQLIVASAFGVTLCRSVFGQRPA
jgi:hypothetical protein